MVETVTLSAQILCTNQPAYFYDLIPTFQRSSQNEGCIYEPSTELCF